MIATLSAGAIGVSTPDLDTAIAKARSGGFDGVEFNAAWIADSIDEIGVVGTQAKFTDAGIVPAVFGLPVDFRNAVDTWMDGLDKLPRLARAAADIGCFRTATWIMPCSNDRAFDANLRFHVERLKPVAEIFDSYGISFGLEFVGPKTLRDTQKYPFVHTMEAMLDMGAKIGPNVGLLLDSFHWYTSHGTVEDLQRLTADKVVYVHLNDGSPDRDPDEQIDGQRDLPLATGVIDLKSFIHSLKHIGYVGPCAIEPFKASLRDLPSDEERMRLVKEALVSTLAL